MPTVIKLEDWEPANGFSNGSNINGIDGWVSTGTALFKTQNAVVYAGTLSLAYSDSTTPDQCYWGTQDSNDGNVSVSSVVRFSGTDALGYWIVAGRMTDPVFSAGNGTWYFARMGPATSSFAGVTLGKRVAGSQTLLGSTVDGSNIATSAWYILSVSCLGSTISTSLQRNSDGFWLDSSGAWQATEQACASLTDTSIVGPGYAGMLANRGSSDGVLYADNWTFTALDLPSSGTNGITIAWGGGIGAGANGIAIHPGQVMVR